jgi:hypothetical protein
VEKLVRDLAVFEKTVASPFVDHLLRLGKPVFDLLERRRLLGSEGIGKLDPALVERLEPAFPDDISALYSDGVFRADRLAIAAAQTGDLEALVALDVGRTFIGHDQDMGGTSADTSAAAATFVRVGLETRKFRGRVMGLAHIFALHGCPLF